MQSWIAECEDFISINYGHKNAPCKIFERYDIRALNGYEQQDLDREKTIIVSALAACLRITPKKNKLQLKNLIKGVICGYRIEEIEDVFEL